MLYYCALIILIIFFRILTFSLQNKGQKIFFILTTLIVIVFQGLRSYSVGTDLVAYIPGYIEIGKHVPINLSATYNNFEIGYILLNKFIYLLGFNKRAFLIIVAIIIQVPIFKTMYAYSENPLLSVFAYFAFGNFIMTFSGLRQAIAMSICFFSYKFIKNKNAIKFAFMILLACFFHKSAVICFVLYPLYYLKIKNIFPLALLVVGICFLFRNQILAILSRVFFGEAQEGHSTGAYTMFIMFLLLYIMANVLQSDDKDYNGLTNILLMIVCIYCLASIHMSVTRLAYPLSLYLTIFIPKVVNNVKFEKSMHQRVFYCLSDSLCVICFILFVGQLGTLPFSFL